MPGSDLRGRKCAGQSNATTAQPLSLVSECRLLAGCLATSMPTLELFGKEGISVDMIAYIKADRAL